MPFRIREGKIKFDWPNARKQSESKAQTHTHTHIYKTASFSQHLPTAVTWLAVKCSCSPDPWQDEKDAVEHLSLPGTN